MSKRERELAGGTSAARLLDSDSRGRRFDSSPPDHFGEMLLQKARTWQTYAAQKETHMGIPIGPDQSTVVLETAPERDARRRREYEAWITASRRMAKHDRIMGYFKFAAFILLGVAVIFALAVLAQNASGAPVSPDIRQTPQVPTTVEPSPTPRKGLSRAEAEAQCIKAGGFWHVDSEPEGLPGREVIGCLWAVPKGWK